MEYRKQQFQTYDEFARQFPTDYTMPFARGGHAELYRGVDAETNDEVAIKRRLYSVGDDLLSLEKEYTNTQEVPASRYVVRYQYYGRYATPFGTYEYLVMRYYRDGNLTNNVLPWAQLSPPLQHRFVEEFLRGLEHLHSHSIVHRDIKPENVLVVRYAEGKKHAYRPVLADFGISKVLAENHEMAQTLIQRSMRVGTVTYMAPEQLRGERITYNSDLWSFGIILYEIITGKHMIARRSFPEQQREEAYSFWRAIDDQQYPANLSTVPQPYQAIIRRCLVVDPAKRTRRATDLLDLMAQPPQFFEAEEAEWAAADALAGTLPTPPGDGVGETPVPLASQLTQQLTEQLDLPLVRPMPTVEPLPANAPMDTDASTGETGKSRRKWPILPFGRKKPRPTDDDEPPRTVGTPLVREGAAPPVPTPVAELIPVKEPEPTPAPPPPAKKPVRAAAPLKPPRAPKPPKPAKEEPVRPPRKPLAQRGRELLSQTRTVARQRWTDTRIPARLILAYRLTGAKVRRGSRAAHQSVLTRPPNRPGRSRYLLGLGVVLVVGTVLTVRALRPAGDAPAATAVAPARPVSTFQDALARYVQHRDTYVKTGQLDNYLWLFINCYPDYEDSLVQSSVLRVDNLISNNMLLFPTYEDNPTELKRLEVKHLIRDKLRWDSKAEKATLPCPSR